ncbi:MAG: HDIG domain-containing protein [Candidatus Kapabacteria bacterium]|nr:HDIG domain-containing protein [Candidatus Kapabacteria bacterium]
MLNPRQTLFQKILVDNAIASQIDYNRVKGSLRLKIFIIIVSLILTSLFFVIKLDQKAYNIPDYRMVAGSTWEDEPLIAEFSYPIFKEAAKYSEERRLAAEEALPVFVIDEASALSNRTALSTILDILEEMLTQQVDKLPSPISEKSLRPLLDLPLKQREMQFKVIKQTLEKYLAETYDNGFVNIALDRIVKSEIMVRVDKNQFIILNKVNLLDRSAFINNAESIISKTIQAPLQALAMEIVNRLNVPNLVFHNDLTDQAIEQAMNSVPRTIGFVRAGEVIIHNKEKLSELNIAKIKSYQSSRFMTDEDSYGLLYYIGNFGHASMILSILIIYLLILRKKVITDNVELSILMGSMVLISLLSWLSIEIISDLPLQYLIFIPAISMLIAIVFDSRTAFVSTVTMSLLMAGIRGNDYITATQMIFVGMLASYTVRDIQNRTQMYQSIFFIFMGFFISILVFSAESSTDNIDLLKSMSLALICSIMSPIITFGLLFMIERLPNISTDLQIKEYDDPDHPLLKKLTEISPGTYQHTMAVAMLAERCAREIGANHLLTKVGTYYHDLGKMEKPEYFTENQIGIENKHEQISPKKSAQIIIDHVAAGIELARQYKLPQRIIDFIPMHHGTTLVKHFYAQALEMNPDKEINESDFRYPGPKPRTKETAILMICDSAEAISRIESKSLEEIENIIEKNIQDRILDGQFDECNITISDLNKIKTVIAKSLIGMGHKRVSYKEIPKKN